MMKDKIKISEIFESIQGEGIYSGVPMLFIRVQGCTRSCWFCDTKYALDLKRGKEYTISDMISFIKSSKLKHICWTGGEPLKWRTQIYQIIDETRENQHHLETNGDLLNETDDKKFDYIAVSPKDLKTMDKIQKLSFVPNIKVVTDLDKTGLELVPFASMLMPLTTYNKKVDVEICKKVWEYCVEHHLRFSPRLQTFIYGKKRGV